MKFEDLLKRAKRGDKDAQEEIFRMYRPLLVKNSMDMGVFDEDLHQEQLLRFLRCVRKFLLDFPEKCNKSSDPKRD